MKKLTDWMEQRSRMSFILMLVVGAYLFYATYNMYRGLDTLTGSPVPIYIFMILFAAVGAALLIVGSFAFVSGHYMEKATERSLETDTDEDTLE